MEWIRFFFGTPQRALATFASLVTVGVMHHCAPGAVGRLVAGAIEELFPLLCYVLLIAVVVTAVQIMLGRH